MDKPFYSPDVPVLFFLARGDFRFGAVQHRLHTRHRVVPTETERWHEPIDGKRVRRKKEKCDQAEQKHSPQDRAVVFAKTVLLPARHFGVHWLHFGFAERFTRHSAGEKIALAGDFGQLGSVTQNAISQARQRRRKSRGTNYFVFFSDTRVSVF